MDSSLTPERWAKVSDLLDRALKLAPTERSEFLTHACADDPLLRLQVESFLSANMQASTDFLRSPVTRVEIAVGSRLGDYEIRSLLGAGGMGEVYRARDTRLRRDVAIKILPSFAMFDPERLRRFEQEALAAAALNHPNVLAVYQFGQHQGSPYLVSELLEGETLRERMNRAPIAQQKAVEYGIEIARALAAAHEKGIVHRDLKPENLFVTRDDHIKILDFGLAKLRQPRHGSETTALTVGSATEPGVVMGTAGYMAPEQIRGETVDDRADIFAFGAILYETITCTRAFGRATSADSMAAILTETPPAMGRSKLRVPTVLERVVFRCLEKNPAQRFQSAAELVSALQTIAERKHLRSGPIRSRDLALISVGLILTIGGIIGAYFGFHRSPKLTQADTIVLADLDNQTGDHTFDDALKQELSIQLEQSPFLRIVSDRKIASTLKLMGRPATERLTGEIARDACARSGGKAVLQATISNFGQQYLLRMVASACVSGDKLAENQTETSGKDGVLRAVNSMAAELRSKLGESIATVQKFDYQGETTTSSFDALRTYAEATKALHVAGPAQAIPLYQHAAQIDPNFAKAYLALGKLYYSTGETNRAAENMSRAMSLADRVSDIERYDIQAEHAEIVSGDLNAALAAYDAWIQDYPRDSTPLHNRATLYMKMGQYEKAIDGFRQAKQLMSDFVYTPISIAFSETKLGRLEDAKSTLDSMRASGFDPQMAWPRFYEVAFLQANPQEMERQLNIGINRPQDRSDALWVESGTEFYRGHLTKVCELTHRATVLQSDAGRSGAVDANLARLARRYADCGDVASARKSAEAALTQQAERLARAQAIAVLAHIGSLDRAETLADTLHSEYPSDTILNRYWLPVIRALIQISKGRPDDAVITLQPALDYESSSVGPLYPAYVRGLAFLANRDGAAAAIEFQKLVDHFGIVSNDPVAALARLQLGRAYALSGDTMKAKASYVEFFNLWKDADADIPILKQAKAEYAKLQ